MDIPTGYNNIKVLMYHRLVTEKPDGEPLYHYVEADQFRKQLELLDTWNFTPITFRDYLLHLEGRLTLPAKPIIITFDDGYLDTYKIAAPILREFNMTAVIYVLGNRSIKSSIWDKVQGKETPQLMDDDQVRELHSEEFEIGSHTMNHIPLEELDEDELRYELTASKSSIEEIIGGSVYSVSYPYGRVDQRVLRITEEVGYKFGCGVYTGPASFGDERFDIRRLAIHQSLNQLQFLMRLLTPYEYAEWIYSRYKQGAPKKSVRLVKQKLNDRPNALSQEP